MKQFSTVLAAGLVTLVTASAAMAEDAALEKKNIELLLSTGKDLELLKGVYGNEIIDTHSEGR